MGKKREKEEKGGRIITNYMLISHNKILFLLTYTVSNDVLTCISVKILIYFIFSWDKIFETFVLREDLDLFI